ncbi:MAG: VirB4 family type IV secretion system protein, partial [Halobacteriales archaeon]
MSSDPTRRVPKKLGKSDEFWRGYTLDDLLVGGTPFIVAVLLTAYVLPPSLRYVGYVLAVIGLVVGAVAVYAAPDYLTASEWVSTYVHHLRRPKEVTHVRYDFDSAREQRDFPESRFYELEERTQELTDIERVHTDRDAVERRDGAYVGAVRVEPANMALATDRRWRDNVAAFADFFNNSVEWPLQLYSTTTEFPVDDYLRRRERRLDDNDVSGNPVFRRLIEEWLDWYPRELEARGTNIREHYVVVPVRRDEVTGADGGDGFLAALANLPVVGGVFGLFSSGDGMTEDEVRERALGELDERLRMVENEGIQNLDGCRAHRVDSDELVRILAEFWEGESAYNVGAGGVRQNPVVAGEYDVEREREDDDIPPTETEEEEEDEGSLLGSLFGGGDGDEDVGEGDVTDDVAETHKSLIAPSEAVFERNFAKLGERWTRTMWAEGYPDQPTNGFLERLFTEPGVETDVAIHVEPRDTRRAQEELKDRVGTLEAEYERKRERRDVGARGVQKDLEDAEEMYDVVRNTPTEVFDVSTYVTVREDTREALESAASDVRAGLRRAPANIRPVTASRRQDLAVRSTSPVAYDHLNKKAAMMGGAVGATFPFSSSTLIEEEGVEYGVHAFNGSPVIVDRFGRETGYNALVIGNIGSGKSFSTKLNLTRTLAQDEDTIVVMLDPLKGFVGVNEALGGERVVVGGNVGLNPLEIRETPDEVLEQTGGELDPFGAKLKDVMSFFESYFKSRGDPLGERRGTLENAVKKAYNDAGIRRDPATHGNDSPLVTDVIDVLREMAENPDEYTMSESDEERRKIETNASELL